ncbi:MAG: 50S ribosomal protein L14e [Candidatus Heimdallarchaeota archaeon LC_2]|nr:MAG: 50S ribosomal protein L14e [Candidatus Heimdallarchaeota archaeon LC_2]
MSAISVGRIVTKIMGREAGRRAVVTQIIDQNFVEVTGPQEFTGVRRRRVNITHIEPTEYSVDISIGDNLDATVMTAIDGDAKLKKFMETKLN